MLDEMAFLDYIYPLPPTPPPPPPASSLCGDQSLRLQNRDPRQLSGKIPQQLCLFFSEMHVLGV